MRNGQVLSQALDCRIKAVELLVQASEATFVNAVALRDAAGALDEVSSSIEYSVAAAAYGALSDLLRIAAMLVEWRSAVLGAGAESGRFLMAAQENYKLWLKEHESTQIPPQYVACTEGILHAPQIASVGDICKALAAVPLPVPYFATLSRIPGLAARINEDDRKAAPVDLTVAFVGFGINGVPAKQTHFMKPRQSHDLEIEVRVSRWPESAESLQLSPVSIEAADSYSLPTFVFGKPKSQDVPFLLKDRGRALLKVPQALNARPYEFKYAAQFFPWSAEQPVAVVGQRTLRIESIDLQNDPITGYHDMDQKLIEIRDQLRNRRSVPEGDLSAALVVLTSLCSLACRALNDGLFPAAMSEEQFQQEVRAELRRIPQIASQLEEHAHAAGGITDLSYRGIRIELKVEARKRITLADCQRYVAQTASYVAATGKRIGILVVLDCTEKDSAPMPAEEGFGILLHKPAEEAIHIVTLIVQGKLKTPSKISR